MNAMRCVETRTSSSRPRSNRAVESPSPSSESDRESESEASQEPGSDPMLDEPAPLEYCVGLGVLASIPGECTRSAESEVSLGEQMAYLGMCIGLLLLCALLSGY